MEFRISRTEPWKIYEHTGNVKRDRLVMWATPSGALMEGPGLGDQAAELYNAVPDSMAKEIDDYWKEK